METGRAMSLGGAVGILACFFLPWVEVSCRNARSFSGAAIGGYLWIVFGAGVVVLVGMLAAGRLRRPRSLGFLAAAAAAVGIGVMLARYVIFLRGRAANTWVVNPEDVELRFRYGCIGTLVSLFVVFVGGLLMAGRPAAPPADSEDTAA